MITTKTVLRTNTSSYFSTDFLNLEKQRVNDIQNHVYLDKGNSGNILITNTHTDFEKLDLENTELIIHPNSGFDNFKYEKIRKLKAPIILGNTIRSNAVASYKMSCLYHRYSPTPFKKNWDVSRKWNRKSLESLNVQIIGFGKIGNLLKKSLKEMVSSIKIYDPFKNLYDLDLSSADVIFMCSSLNQSSHYFLAGETFNKLKKNITIINGARGSLICEKDLIAFLADNPNACAYLDVFEKEPHDFSSFSHLNNIFLTSHQAGVFEGLEKKMLDFEVSVLNDFNKLSLKNFLDKYREDNLHNRSKLDFI